MDGVKGRFSEDSELENTALTPAPWAGPVGSGAEQPIIRRKKFTPAEVRGLDFVGGYDFDQLPSVGLPEIAFLGRSNVGKSSMLNTLAGPGQKPALVSKMPGRTQRINLFRVGDSKGPFCCFADLPGYGYAKISQEKQRGIEGFLQKYLAERVSLDLVVLLVDSRREPQEADIEVRFHLFPFCHFCHGCILALLHP